MSVDHWGDDEFLLTPEHLRAITLVDKLRNFSRRFLNKKIYVTTTCPFLHEYFENLPNIKIIHWGEDFLMHPNTCYHKLAPVYNKKFDKEWHWIYLSNNIRMHRSIGGLFILGENIKNGFLKFDSRQLLEHESWQSFKSYLKSNNYKYLHSIAGKIYPILEKGFNRVKNFEGYILNEYKNVSNAESQFDADFGKNFDKYSRFLFSSSTVEIINETILINRTGIITEKYLNSVYGLNFPIILNMSGVVKHLKSLGLDMFDDIVDHGYDEITDHYTRMVTAIQSNKRLLEDRQLTIDSWNKCQDRFRANINIIESMYENKERLALSKIFREIESST